MATKIPSANATSKVGRVMPIAILVSCNNPPPEFTVALALSFILAGIKCIVALVAVIVGDGVVMLGHNPQLRPAFCRTGRSDGRYFMKSGLASTWIVFEIVVTPIDGHVRKLKHPRTDW